MPMIPRGLCLLHSSRFPKIAKIEQNFSPDGERVKNQIKSSPYGELYKQLLEKSENKGDIDNNIINNNNNTVDHDKRRYITKEYVTAVQKWVSTCEQSLVDGNGELVKEIFLLKAVHGFRDQNNTITVEHVMKPVIDADNLPDLIGINSKN